MHALPQGLVRWRGMDRAGTGQGQGGQEGQGRVRDRAGSGPGQPWVPSTQGPSGLHDNGVVSAGTVRKCREFLKLCPAARIGLCESRLTRVCSSLANYCSLFRSLVQKSPSGNPHFQLSSRT